MKTKKIIAITSIILLLSILTATFFFISKKQPNKIVFYGIEERQKTSIKEVIKKICDENNLLFEIEDFDNDELISKQFSLFKKPSIIITNSESAVDFSLEIADKQIFINTNVLSQMTSTMRSSAKVEKFDEKNNSVKSIPLISDFFGIEVDFSAFRNSGMKSINTWEDIEMFASIQKRKVDYPIIFAGGDSRLFMDLLGALTESLSMNGLTDYNKAKEILTLDNNEKFNPARIANKLSDADDAPLYDAIRYLSRLYKLGFIHPDVFSLSKKDVNAFMRAKLANVIFMTLNDHREIDNNAIKRFTTIYFPSKNSPSNRRFTANITKVIPISKSNSVRKLIEELVNIENQEILGRTSGLATVLSHARTPDKQADDVRYWLASTNTPFTGLSNDCNLSKNELDQVAKEIATKIKELGK